MKILKVAFAIPLMLCSAVSFAATPNTVAVKHAAAPVASTCYYRYSIITPDATYDVYECYDNGNGTA